jgi:hypothetical protein
MVVLKKEGRKEGRKDRKFDMLHTLSKRIAALSPIYD